MVVKRGSTVEGLIFGPFAPYRGGLIVHWNLCIVATPQDPTSWLLYRQLEANASNPPPPPPLTSGLEAADTNCIMAEHMSIGPSCALVPMLSANPLLSSHCPGVYKGLARFLT